MTKPTHASSQPDDPTDVTIVRGNERLARMLAKPGMKEAVAARRAEMHDADRAHAMGLAALRKAAELTQTELAQALGVSQAAVGKTEQREDLLLPLSTPTSRHSAAKLASSSRSTAKRSISTSGLSAGTPHPLTAGELFTSAPLNAGRAEQPNPSRTGLRDSERLRRTRQGDRPHGAK
jgi:transcriptional regulator with XRE-family HTH domain